MDTACSSSLVALHLACESIWNGDSSSALVGGSNAILKPEMTLGFGYANMLAQDGRCKSFDARANGYVRAEGAWQRAVTWLPKALLGVAAGGSFALNIAHAPAHLGARMIAALPPAALVLTFEILMMIVRRAVAARVTRLGAQQEPGVAGVVGEGRRMVIAAEEVHGQPNPALSQAVETGFENGSAAPKPVPLRTNSGACSASEIHAGSIARASASTSSAPRRPGRAAG